MQPVPEDRRPSGQNVTPAIKRGYVRARPRGSTSYNKEGLLEQRERKSDEPHNIATLAEVEWEDEPCTHSGEDRAPEKLTSVAGLTRVLSVGTAPGNADGRSPSSRTRVVRMCIGITSAQKLRKWEACGNFYQSWGAERWRKGGVPERDLGKLSMQYIYFEELMPISTNEEEDETEEDESTEEEETEEDREARRQKWLEERTTKRVRADEKMREIIANGVEKSFQSGQRNEKKEGEEENNPTKEENKK